MCLYVEPHDFHDHRLLPEEGSRADKILSVAPGLHPDERRVGLGTGRLGLGDLQPPLLPDHPRVYQVDPFHLVLEKTLDGGYRYLGRIELGHLAVIFDGDLGGSPHEKLPVEAPQFLRQLDEGPDDGNQLR